MVVYSGHLLAKQLRIMTAIIPVYAVEIEMLIAIKPIIIRRLLIFFNNFKLFEYKLTVVIKMYFSIILRVHW